MTTTRPARGRAAHPLRKGRAQRQTWRKSLLLHVVGIVLGVCGTGITLSAVVDAGDGGPDAFPLAGVGLITTVAGIAAWRATTLPRKIVQADVFTTVAGAWVAMAVVGAVPYVVTGTLVAPHDALFESVSGFTTTGATVLRPIEDASAGILMWRSITQWLGGMGVIVLVVAVLPTVGSGGMDLLAAEAPGPTGERLTPRVTQTARRLWGIYLGFTVILALAYALAGMSAFDAVAHSFTTVATGGFSTHSESMAYFDSALIEWIAILAMFAGGTSFTLLYKVVRGRPGPLVRSIEFRLYCTVVLAAVALVFLTNDAGAKDIESLRHATFVVLAVVTTTGYGLGSVADYAQWSQAAQAVVLILIPVGAMAGSTAGGVKLVRILAIASYARREILRQIHPRLVRSVHIGDAALEDEVANKVLGFLVLTVAIFGSVGLLIALSGADLVTAFSASATLLGNVGPGLGEVGPTQDFLNLHPFARVVGILTMLLGRLEIYPVLLALVSLRARLPRELRVGG